MKTVLSQFLTNREEGFKPNDPELAGLKRLEKIDFSGKIHLSDKPTKTDMIVVQPGDLVISGINVSKGAIAVYEGNEPLAATIHYSSYAFDEKQIDISYFRRFLKSPIFVQELKTQVKGGIKTEIKPHHLLPIVIDLPRRTEQEAIVKHFESFENELQDLDSQTASQKEILSLLRQSILQEAVEGKLTAEWRKNNPAKKGDPEYDASALLEKIKAEKQKMIAEGKIKKEKPLPPIKPEEIPFELPEGWVWCRLGEVCLKITDGTHHSPINTMSGTIPYVTAKNIKNEGIDLSDITYVTKEVHKEIYNRCNVEFGDVLYIKDGATTGIVTVNNLDEPFSMLSSVALLKPFIFNRYLMYSMRSPIFYNETRAQMYGVAITRVTLEKLTNALIPLPPLAEQKAIVERVDHLLSMVDELEKQVAERKTLAEDLMQSVLREAFEE